MKHTKAFRVRMTVFADHNASTEDVKDLVLNCASGGMYVPNDPRFTGLNIRNLSIMRERHRDRSPSFEPEEYEYEEESENG